MIYYNLHEIAYNNFANEDLFWESVDLITDHKPETLIEVVDWFILNLKENHRLSGKDWETLTGIAHYARENHFATEKQYRHATLVMAANITEIAL